MFLKRCFTFILLLCSYLLSGQNPDIDKNDYYVRAAFNYGMIVKQHPSVGQVVNGNIWGAEVNYVKPTAGNKLWHHENNFPEYGVGFSFFNLDNPKQLGNLYALYFFYDIPLNKTEKPFRLHLRISEGLAYAPVHFDPITNHKNELISNPENVYINFKWYYRWNLSKQLCWEAGLNFSHASNGRFKVPNLGINMLTLNSGFIYKIPSKHKTPISCIDSCTKACSKNELLFWLAYGANEVGQPEGPKYLAQSYSAAYYYNKRNTHKFGGGIDVYYNAATLAQLKSDGAQLSSNLQNIQVGVKFAYAYNIGRLSLPIEMGYYLYSRYKDDGMIFHRIGMRYYMKNNMVAIISLKTQWAVANYIEFGFGYRVPLKQKVKV